MRAHLINPLPDNKILDFSKLKEFADNVSNLFQNGRKLSKWVENTVGKGEIARYEQFLLFPQCFQKACFQGVSKGVIVWEWVNTHLVVPRSRSSFRVRYQGHVFKRMAVAGAFVFHKHILICNLAVFLEALL